MTKAVYIVRGFAATAMLCSSAAAHIRGSYEVLHGQVLAAATYEVLKQPKYTTSAGHRKFPLRQNMCYDVLYRFLEKSDFCKFGHIRGFALTTTIYCIIDQQADVSFHSLL